MKQFGIFVHAYWYWIGVVALIGYVCLFNFIFTLTLTFLGREYLNPSSSQRLCHLNLITNAQLFRRKLLESLLTKGGMELHLVTSSAVVYACSSWWETSCALRGKKAEAHANLTGKVPATPASRRASMAASLPRSLSRTGKSSQSLLLLKYTKG
jgi:hypothetical protein